jgi:threonine/homoserine/homoserine lactone efflux protein
LVTYLLSGFVLGFPNAAVPGPFQAYLLFQTMKNGWKRTLPVALAPLLSDGPIIVLVLFTLSRLGQQTLGGIQMVGAGFVFYLAYGAYRSFRAASDNPKELADPIPSNHGVLKGALMNALNPAPYIFWGAVGGPILLEGFKDESGGGIAFLIGFYGTLVGGFAVLIWFFGTVGQLGPGVRKILSAVSALALFLFGMWQLTGGIRLLVAGGE